MNITKPPRTFQTATGNGRKAARHVCRGNGQIRTQNLVIPSPVLWQLRWVPCITSPLLRVQGLLQLAHALSVRQEHTRLGQVSIPRSTNMCWHVLHCALFKPLSLHACVMLVMTSFDWHSPPAGV